MGCTCFGYRELFLIITKNLVDTIVNLIEKYRTDNFITVGMGESDRLFSEGIRILTKYLGIKPILVLLYMTNESNKSEKCYISVFDDIIIPE